MPNWSSFGLNLQQVTELTYLPLLGGSLLDPLFLFEKGEGEVSHEWLVGGRHDFKLFQ